MVSFTSPSSSSMPRSGIKYAYQDQDPPSSRSEDKINNFSQIVSEDFWDNRGSVILNGGDTILIVLRDIYRNPNSSITFPEITASNACLKLFRKRIAVEIKMHQDIMVNADNFLDDKEYRIEILKPRLNHEFMIKTLGVKVFSQLQSAFRDADELIYSFLKQPIQNVNLFKIKQIKNWLVAPEGYSPPTIEKDFKRIQSIVRFLFTTLSTYETCALQKKPLHQLNFMQLILTSTPLLPPLIEEVMKYVADDCEISIKYDVEDNLKQQQQLSKKTSIFSCFSNCECW